MQIDTTYIKTIIEKFIDSETNFISTSEFKSMINEDIEKFMFHWDLLLDKYLIVNTKGEKAKIFTHGYNDVSIMLGAKVRLHDNGHEFYNMLCDDTVVEKIKNKFNNLSMDILTGLSKNYMESEVTNFFN